MKGESCLTDLLEFFEDVTSKVDNGDPMDVEYLDFRKAFDKVPHKRLIHKVRSHGIRGNLLAWIGDWLMDTTENRDNVLFSGWSEVTSGVPRGSVLGPQLFTIYINDLDTGIEGSVAKFAGDTKIGGTVSCNEEIRTLQMDIDRLGEWAKMWQM